VSSGQGTSSDARAALDAAACGLLLTSADGTFLRVNRTFCQWVGHAPEELVERRRFQELLTMGGRIFHQTHWAPLLQMQGSISEVKLEVLHRDGTTIPMVLNAIRHEEKGVVVHELAAFVARDRDKYERELVQSRKRLEELVAETARLHADAKDRVLVAEQMIGIVSHDLRNPLSNIGLGIALLSGDMLSDSQRRTLGRITRSTERANVLVADLLDFTQARLGKGLSVSIEEIDLHDTVSHALDELAAVHSGRTLRHVRVGDGVCSADANRLGQLVGNLVSNAMAYGAPGTAVTVTSSIEKTSFVLSVHNEGVPIPEQAQAELFQPMKRGATATPNVGRSVGLGLFNVSEIARAHGGQARVQSTHEGGTTFSAVFPRRVASENP
jgi:sigma-B regulation protein RsbU (phosphoserine phosphatase)